MWFSALAEAVASQDISDCSFFHVTSNFVETAVCGVEDVPHQLSNMPLNAPRCTVATVYFKSVPVKNKVAVSVSFVRRA